MGLLNLCHDSDKWKHLSRSYFWSWIVEITSWNNKTSWRLGCCIMKVIKIFQSNCRKITSSRSYAKGGGACIRASDYICIKTRKKTIPNNYPNHNSFCGFLRASIDQQWLNIKVYQDGNFPIDAWEGLMPLGMMGAGLRAPSKSPHIALMKGDLWKELRCPQWSRVGY